MKELLFALPNYGLAAGGSFVFFDEIVWRLCYFSGIK